ncbi:MAG: release factor glutamine methyltransferase [Frankiales bacterium]|nr:release factor glutamine methyltransferase [Frankiales bacterium]
MGQRVSELKAEIKAATDRLKEAGLPSPRVDAEELAAHVAKVDRTQLHTVDSLDTAVYRRLVERRASREPLQHITGRAHFRGITVQVGPGVFVPRPETEVVAGWAIEALAGVRAPVVVDLCSGSGVLALSIAEEVPGAKVHAVELDQRAVAWLERNARGTRVSVHRADAAVALPQLDGKVHAVVSNPPYVGEEELADVDVEVRDHDPLQALTGGPDGLDVIRVIERRARRLLRRGGLLVIEHSDRQGTSAPELVEAAGGWSDVADHKDLTGRDRFVTARWEG